MRVRDLCLSLCATLFLASPALADPPGVGAAPSVSLEETLAPIASDRVLRRTNAAVQVIDLRTGEEVFARNPDARLVPASTTKMVTAATALRTLGPSYRFTTEVWTDGTLDAAGVLHGNLYVKGGADPTLVVEKLWKLIVDLKLDGLARIEGDVVYDEDFFGPDHELPGWDKPADVQRGPSYYPPIGALSLNYNTAAIVVGPGSEVGGPARVALETPASSYITLENHVVTGSAGSRTSLDYERIVEPTGLMKFVVSGSVPSSATPEREYRTVADPSAYFRAVFADLLESQGVRVTGRHRMGSTPTSGGRRLHTLRSPALSSVLMDMNKLSNNFIAETVLRTVGAEVHGQPGTTANGLRAMSDYLTSLGLDPGSYRIVNGSGLSRDTTFAPSLLTAVLADMGNDERVGAEFQSSLAIAGLDGTLWRRLRDEPGRIRAKTGTIDGIHCLAGYASSDDGRRYAFAFMVNDISGGIWQVRDLHDRFARELLLVDAAETP